MFQKVGEAVNTLKEIRAYSEDIAQLSSFIIKKETDEYFSELVFDKDDMFGRDMINQMSTSISNLSKLITKLKRYM